MLTEFNNYLISMDKLSHKPIHVNYIIRKPQQGYYSVERVFHEVKKVLVHHLAFTDVYLPYFSRGIGDRIKNIFFCRRLKRTAINHITGDVNYLASFMSSKTTVLTILDCVYQFNTTGLKKWFIWMFWYYLPVRRCRFITAISEFSKLETIKVTGVDASRIEVVYVALPDGFEPHPKEINTTSPVILHVGNTPNKNLNTLIAAIENVPCELWVVGQLTPEQQKRIHDCGIHYKEFKGIKDEELIDLYTKCDIVSFVSLYEGFGMPVIEGQATGRPVITSNRGSLPEIAGDAAIIVSEPENPQALRSAILQVITDADLRQSLIMKGYENVKRFNRERLAKQYLKLYERVQSGI